MPWWHFITKEGNASMKKTVLSGMFAAMCFVTPLKAETHYASGYGMVESHIDPENGVYNVHGLNGPRCPTLVGPAPGVNEAQTRYRCEYEPIYALRSQSKLPVPGDNTPHAMPYWGAAPRPIRL